MHPTESGSPPESPQSSHLRPAVSTGGGRSRSSIPFVIGILAIVFAVLGLLTSMLVAIGLTEELDAQGVTKSELGAFGTWMYAALIPSLLLFGLHLTGGIFCVTYKKRAPLLITLYGIGALVLAATDIGLSIALFPEGASTPMFDDLVGPRIGLQVISAFWPIVALILMNVPGARAACTR